MSHIALVSNNDIVSKIFILVTKKLSLSIDVFADDSITTPYEFVIVDDDVPVDIKKIDLFAATLLLLSS